MRCPIRMVKVLKIRNAPTSRAMTAKTSRKVLKRLKNESKPAAVSEAAWAALTAS